MILEEERGPGEALTERAPGPFADRSRRSWLSALAPPILLMSLIFVLGTDRASASETQGFLARLLERFAPELYARFGPEELRTLNYVTRKSGHFFGYALLGLLNARAARGLSGNLTPRLGALAWAGAVAWAAVDEYHQSFSPGRQGAVEDVYLDGVGALAGIALYLSWTRRCRRNG